MAKKSSNRFVIHLFHFPPFLFPLLKEYTLPSAPLSLAFSDYSLPSLTELIVLFFLADDSIARSNVRHSLSPFILSFLSFPFSFLFIFIYLDGSTDALHVINPTLHLTLLSPSTLLSLLRTRNWTRILQLFRKCSNVFGDSPITHSLKINPLSLSPLLFYLLILFYLFYPILSLFILVNNAIGTFQSLAHSFNPLVFVVGKRNGEGKLLGICGTQSYLLYKSKNKIIKFKT